jgi:hypothetical protein
MRRIDFYGLFYDGRAFFARNKLKFLAAFIVVAAAALFGVWRAFAAGDPSFSSVWKFNIMRLITGERNAFIYFIFRFLLLLCVAALLALSGIRFWTSWIAYAVLFVYAYFAANQIGVLFILSRLAVLPLALVCLIPAFIVSVCVLSFLAVHAVSASFLRGRYARFYDFYIDARRPFLIAAVLLLIAAALESLLAFVLTLGIIL